MNTTPWDDKVLGLTKVQSDLLIELYGMEHPELGIKGAEPDIRNERTVAHQLVAWSNVLRGKALKEFIKSPIGWLKKNYG